MEALLRRDYPTVDGFQASEIHFENAAPGDVLLGDDIRACQNRSSMKARVAICAESCGVTASRTARWNMRGAQPVRSTLFSPAQASKHRCIDMFMEAECPKSDNWRQR
jgi:hypothetical protein